ncbi:MAG: hypothetical protein ACTHOP_10265 [Mesorhizobium sp.]
MVRNAQPCLEEGFGQTIGEAVVIDGAVVLLRRDPGPVRIEREQILKGDEERPLEAANLLAHGCGVKVEQENAELAVCRIRARQRLGKIGTAHRTRRITVEALAAIGMPTPFAIALLCSTSRGHPE